MASVSGSLPTVLGHHLEELVGLLQVRVSACQDAEYTVGDIAALDERIEAQVDGLLTGGQQSLPLLQELLAGDPLAVFAAAQVLLRMNEPIATSLVVDAMLAAAPEQLVMLCQALSNYSTKLVQGRLVELCDTGSPLVAAAAAEVLARHHCLNADAKRLNEFYVDENPEVRKAAWRIAALVDSAKRNDE